MKKSTKQPSMSEASAPAPKPATKKPGAKAAPAAPVPVVAPPPLAPAPAPAAKKKAAPKAPAPVAVEAAAAAPKASAAPSPAKRPLATAVPRPTTRVVAHVDVGFGNRLTVRGEGAGLAWDRGVDMTCEGGDQWVWTTAAAEGPVLFKVLLNDETWAAGGDLVVEPGQTVVFTPSF